MTIPRLILCTLVGVVMWLCIFAIGGIALAHATPVKKKAAAPDIVWPQSPCNLDHRMDIAIVENMFFECQCLRLHIGHVCDWYLIAGVDAPAESKRKIVKRALATHHRITRIYALPAVTR